MSAIWAPRLFHADRRPSLPRTWRNVCQFIHRPRLPLRLPRAMRLEAIHTLCRRRTRCLIPGLRWRNGKAAAVASYLARVTVSSSSASSRRARMNSSTETLFATACRTSWMSGYSRPSPRAGTSSAASSITKTTPPPRNLSDRRRPFSRSSPSRETAAVKSSSSTYIAHPAPFTRSYLAPSADEDTRPASCFTASFINPRASHVERKYLRAGVQCAARAQLSRRAGNGWHGSAHGCLATGHP